MCDSCVWKKSCFVLLQILLFKTVFILLKVVYCLVLEAMRNMLLIGTKNCKTLLVGVQKRDFALDYRDLGRGFVSVSP